MDFISFVGCRKTSDEFLGRVRQASGSPGQLVANLRALSIFSSVAPEVKSRKEKIVLEEAAKSIKIRAHSNGKRSIALSFPNIFGCGECARVDYNGADDCMLTLGVPSFCGKHVLHNKLSVGAETRACNDKKIAIRRLELSSGTDGSTAALGCECIRSLLVYFARCDFKVLGFGAAAKLGVTAHEEREKNVLSPFLKAVLSRSVGLATERFSASAKFSVGRIFGSSNLTEKFFLGPEVRGYRPMAISPVSHNKKVGGNSFASVRTQAGVYAGPLELFVFADAGVTSVRGLKQCYEIAASLSDNNCMGRSVGCGASLRNNKGLSFIYSVPLTKNEDVESYTLGMDIKF